MKHHLRRSDTQALLDGQPAPDGDEALADVDAFLTTLRNDFGARPAPAPRPVLASILDGRRPLRTVAEPVVATSPRPASLLGWNRWPRPVAAALATGTLLFSGLAAAGALPAPLQRVSADVGDQMGVHLPRPSVSTPAPAHDARRSKTGTGSRGANGTPGSGAGRTGPGQPGSSTTNPMTGPSGPLAGASGAVPTVPTTPSLRIPVPRPAPGGLLPSVTTRPDLISSGDGQLLHDLPHVSRVVHSP